MAEQMNEVGAGVVPAPTTANEELHSLRRHFSLPEVDAIYLDDLGYPWETLNEGRGRWVLIHDHPLPEGYSADCASIAVQITPGYPTAHLDMAYFYPALSLTSGRAIPQSKTRQRLDGKTWQRWSRHRTGANRWQPGIDNLQTHHALILAWLAREPKR